MINNIKLYESDYYFNENYAQLYCNSKDRVLQYEKVYGNNKFVNISIISPLPNSISVNDFDASTPYGYGGISTDIVDVDLLKVAFSDYKLFLKEEKVIAEFFRFHPFIDTKELEGELDFFERERQVVYIDLENGVENRWKGYSSTTRNILRKAKKRLEVSESHDIKEFLDLYNKTMQKNNASQFYFFDIKYFENLLKIPNTKLLKISLDGIPVSMGIFFFKGQIAHYHLSANNYDYQKEQGNYLLLDYASDIAEKLNCKYLMLGGGRTKDENDSLLRFKTKFSPLKKNFYIGGLISNREKYEKAGKVMLDQNVQQQTSNYFLNYRL